MQKIVPHLWFDTEAEDAANLYTSVFENAKILNVSHYGEAGPRPAGMVMTVTFELEGQTITALNGGPEFKFTEAISLLVNCEGQEEVDYLWNKLSSDGGEEGPCGWLKDKYGLSWQIIPTILEEMLQDEDADKANRVMKAMLQMGKIDVAALEEAYGPALEPWVRRR
ncbi:MAG: VOC family protein [Actinomycetota bacterium]